MSEDQSGQPFQCVRITVPQGFASRKVAHDWAAAGMSRDSTTAWRVALAQAAEPHCAVLRQAIALRMHLKITVTVVGPRIRVDGLDVHDALAQTIDDLTNVLFPRPPSSRSPQWQDKYFWEVSARKCIDGDARVEIEIQPLGESWRERVECQGADMERIGALGEAPA